MTASPVRRFYKEARTIEVAGGPGVALDARTLKTPAGAPLVTPTWALAEACAQEWQSQAEFIKPASMPITQLTFAAIDWTRPAREQRIEYVASFGATDLCCHRAEAPAELAARQEALWGPLVRWLDDALGAPLPVITGVIAADVPEQSLETLREHARACDDFALTALSQGAGLTGSAVLAFALQRQQIDAHTAFAAAALDELWSLERWGEDAEARARIERLHAELAVLHAFIAALA